MGFGEEDIFSFYKFNLLLTNSKISSIISSDIDLYVSVDSVWILLPWRVAEELSF